MAIILLAEDDEGVRSFVKRALELEGHKVIATEDGEAALDIVKEIGNQIDLLLSDIKMPFLDGISLAKKTHSLFPKLPILLMTGYADQREGAKELRDIIVDVISKPFSLQVIREKVGQTLKINQQKKYLFNH